jgi:lipopolysaccharide/colanic/teichoic acid biosynthesis glycosyltransferase/glycosyltransferase involved in cell wall biosynthesis
MRVALVHDWLTGMRGGERVLAELCRLFPGATLFTLLHRRGSVDPLIEARPIRTSFLGALPSIERHYRYWLPLYPLAAWSLDLEGFDLVLSSSHAAAKAVRTPAGSLHVCYCHTPMRYIWDAQPDYFGYGDRLGARRTALRLATGPLRAWDRRSAGRVDHFIANSEHVRRRIAACYGRAAEVIYPPVATDFFTPVPGAPPEPADFYLVVSALVPAKRLDLAIDAFGHSGRPLVVAGSGPDAAALRRRARPNVRFLGFVPDEELRRLYRSCRALVLPGREDFGITAVEAQACGRPVIAHAAGGALESVLDGETGILFEGQTTADLEAAVARLESTRFDPALLRAHAERFGAARFRAEIEAAIGRVVQSPPLSRPVPSLRLAAREPGPAHPSVAGLSGAAKRGLDAAAAALALLALAVPILALAALVRASSPGPAFFRQRRLGWRGRPFVIIKLRTRVEDAERGRGPTWAVDDDARCTPLGGFLRRHGIDELPQLWNVLKGEMSLVGPRPERPEFVERFERELPRYRERLAVRGGLTGLAQIQGWRGDSSLEERLAADLEYIGAWSLGRDLAILARTPLALGRMRRAARERRRERRAAGAGDARGPGAD